MQPVKARYIYILGVKRLDFINLSYKDSRSIKEEVV
jgi:hypothetical protein